MITEPKNMPYTEGIKTKIINEIKEIKIEEIVSLSNPEFLAGAEYQKNNIINKINKIKFY